MTKKRSTEKFDLRTGRDRIRAAISKARKRATDERDTLFDLSDAVDRAFSIDENAASESLAEFFNAFARRHVENLRGASDEPISEFIRENVHEFFESDVYEDATSSIIDAFTETLLEKLRV